MKKNKLFIVLGFYLTFLLFYSASLRAQMQHMFLYPDNLDMTNLNVSSAPSFSPTPSFPPFSDAAYDEDGAALFYIAGKGVYNSSGNFAFNLPGHGNSASGCTVPGFMGNIIANKLVIVPVPGECRKFYVIYALSPWYELPGDNTLVYVTITVAANGTLTLGSTGTYMQFCPPLPISYTAATLVQNFYRIPTPEGIGMAVSKPYSGKNRYLFIATGDGELARYTITSSGIGNKTVLAYDYSGPEAFLAMEMTISPDQNYLAWVGGPSNTSRSVYQVTLNNYNYSSIKRFNAGDEAFSVVYNAASSTLYMSDDDGIHSINPASSSGSSFGSAISGTSGYASAPLRLGYDSKIYACGNGSVISMDINSGNAISTVSGVSSYYTLPIQVEGEDYQYFYTGISIGFSSSQLNGNSPNLLASPYLLYTCKDMELTGTSTYSNGRSVQVRSIDASGTYLSGGSYLGTYTASWLNGNIDLKSMPGTNGTWLADPAHAGYYEVSVITENTCGIKTAQTFYIQLAPPPDAPVLKVNGEDPNSTSSWLELYTCQDIELTGIGSPTPDPEQYKVDITQLLSDGTPLGTGGYTGSYINYTGQTAVDLKNLPGTDGDILGDPANGGKYYKVKVTTKDLCGNETDESFYIHLNAPPSAATIDLAMYRTTSPVFCTARSIASACAVAGSSPIYFFAQSLTTTFGSNNIDEYARKIVEVDCITGDEIQTIYEDPSPLVSNPNDVATGNLNQIFINGNQGYFFDAAKIGLCYKLVVHASNICDDADDLVYFTIGSLFKPGRNDNSTNVKATQIADEKIVLVQNPINNIATFAVTLFENRNIVCYIYDISGNIVLEHKENLLPEKSIFSLNTETLASGVYFYKISNGQSIFHGKMLK